MEDGAKKRKFTRGNKPYMVKFRLKPGTDTETSGDWDMVAIRNLSATGLYFYCNTDLGVNSLLDMKLDILSTIPTITCVGSIIRIKRKGNAPMVGVAVTFTDISEQDKELLNKAAEETLSRNKAEA